MKNLEKKSKQLIFKIINLGCKVNLYESNNVQNELLSAGYIKATEKEAVDVFVINTCTVTNKADSKSLLIIRNCFKTNPKSIIVVMGCYSQLNSEALKTLPVHIVIGNKYKNKVVELIQEYLSENKPIYKIDNLLLETKYEETVNDVFYDNTRAFIKIQDGCNFMCSYCTIPLARGKQRSKDHEKILKEILNLVSNGYKEVVLTGVNTAGYFENENYDFYNLLKDINNLPGDFRVRISSLEPFQINSKIVDLICSNHSRWCQHWHICLQSSDNEILKKMNRKYTSENFSELISEIRSKSPKTIFTTDLIVGFPSESKENFRNSIENIKKINLFNAHIFRYSKRENTLANLLSQQIQEKIKSARAKFLDVYFKNQQNEILNTFIGETVEVLFEKSKDQDFQHGHSSQYFEVFVKTNKNLSNEIHKVLIEQIIEDKAYGKLI